MKLPVFNQENRKSGEKELPGLFAEEYRPDLIKRAVLAFQSTLRQRYGASPEAGKRSSSKLSKRRRKYRGCYGFGISRVNRKILSRRGMRMNWVGAFTPQTTGGRRAHPPKAEKIRLTKINQKEKRKGIRSAMAATLNRSLVKERGHLVPDSYPFLTFGDLESVSETKQVWEILNKLGFGEELSRSSVKRIRAGKGTLRGRKYRRRKGLLIVVSGDCPLSKAARNLPGVDVVSVKKLNAGLLAPGALPGRAALWTEKAIEVLTQEKLFV